MNDDLDQLSAYNHSDCAGVPEALRELVHELAHSGHRCRTGIALLPSADYAVGSRWASQCLRLRPIHMGRVVVAWCEQQGTEQVAMDAMGLLRHILDVHLSVRELMAQHLEGTWLWGLDVLLAKLDDEHRRTFWTELWALRQRPPLLVALPAALASDFGPEDFAMRWSNARPLRGVLIEAQPARVD